MEVDKSEFKVLQRAITEWQQEGKLTAEKAEELKQTLEFKQTERQQIAQYFFFIALGCTLLAFGAIFINEKLLERIKAYFSWDNLAIAGITAVLGAVWFWYTSRKRRHITPALYEIYMVLGGLSILTSLLYLCKDLGIDKTYTAFLSISLPLLAILAVLLQSRALWVGAVIAAIAWYGSFTSWQSTDNLFLGMNYAMRYVVFGLLLMGVSYVQLQIKPAAFTSRITYTTGLLLFFTAMWMVSIFGNFNTISGWQQVRQIHIVAYSIVFGIAAALSFYLGIRYKEDLARDFGVIFLLINLYTRYFEYFWDAMNKGIFFLILAVTFGVLGWWLERKVRSTRKTNTVSQP